MQINSPRPKIDHNAHIVDWKGMSWENVTSYIGILNPKSKFDKGNAMPLLLLSQEQFKQILALLTSLCHQSSASTQLDTKNHIANLVAKYSVNQCLQNLFGKILSLVSVQGSSNLDLKHFIFSFNLVNLSAYSSSTWVSYWPYSPLHFMFHKLCCRSKIFVQLSNG